MKDDKELAAAWFDSILASDLTYQATGLRYSSEDVEEFGAQLQAESGCSTLQAQGVAVGVLANHIHSETIRSGFKINKRLVPTRKKLLQELTRLTRTERPQDDALNVSGIANSYISQALYRDKQFALVTDWKERSTLATRTERVCLIRAIAPFAEAALIDLRQLSSGRGRPSDHANETFIAGTTGILHEILGVPPNPNNNSPCRVLIELCARYCGVERKDFLDSAVRSELIERAISMYNSKTLRFHHVMIARPANRP